MSDAETLGVVLRDGKIILSIKLPFEFNHCGRDADILSLAMTAEDATTIGMSLLDAASRSVDQKVPL